METTVIPQPRQRSVMSRFFRGTSLLYGGMVIGSAVTYSLSTQSPYQYVDVKRGDEWNPVSQPDRFRDGLLMGLLTPAIIGVNVWDTVRGHWEQHH